jgi:hypothetical protein
VAERLTIARTVGGKKFAMTSSDTDCFHEGVVYRIYYTDIGVGSLAILSAEAIG